MKVYSMHYLIMNRYEGGKFVQVICMLNRLKFASNKVYIYTSSIKVNLVPICKYVKLIFILSRSRSNRRGGVENPLVAFSSQDLMTRATRKMMDCRNNPSSDEMQILIERSEVNPWRASGDLEKSILMKYYVGYRPVMGRGCDKSVMSTYLKCVDVSCVQIPRGIKFEDYLPAGAPILDFLAISMEKMECWQIPTRCEINKYQRTRGLSLRMIQEVEVKEIIIGETSPGKCKEIFSWFWENHRRDQKTLPTAVCSMDNEEIRISLVDVYRMAGKIGSTFPRKIADNLVDHDLLNIPEDRWMQLPVRVMIGNGITYALMITIALDRDQRSDYILNRVHIQEEVIEFVEEMPVCTGLGVRGDVADLEFFYSLFSGKEVSCRGFIDLGALAVLSGYNMRAMSMTPMGVNVSGHTLNKCASTGDGKWSWRWDELPDSLKVYCLGDLKFGFMTYNILSSVLVRDLFPDPDILLKFLGVTDQVKAVAWILELVMMSLDGVEIHNVDFDAARTRVEMIKSLRFRYSYDSPLMETSPARVLIWCEILGDWPALTSGGCRFLAQAREWFLTQARVLRSSGFKWTCGVKMKSIGPYFISYARFGLAPKVIHAADYSETVPAYSGLFRPRSLKSTLCQFNPVTVKPATLSKFAKKEGKVLKAVIFEWARYYPNQIQPLLQRMMDDKAFRHYTMGLYRGLRVIHKRINGTEAVCIQELEDHFGRNLEEQLRDEQARMKKSQEVLRAREARCAHIAAVLRNKDQDDQTLWLNEIPRLPDWIHRRRSRKRVKSKASHPNPKRIRIDGEAQETVGSQPEGSEPKSNDQPVVVDEGEPVVIIDSMEDDEFGIPGINDPKPVCRKKISQKKKKKKGKKSKVAKDTRTYDEIIEAEKYVDSDEFNLEFSFTDYLD